MAPNRALRASREPLLIARSVIEKLRRPLAAACAAPARCGEPSRLSVRGVATASRRPSAARKKRGRRS